jgi:hypothetical protein
MEKPENIYWKNFPLITSIVVGIFPLVLLYFVITSPNTESIKMFLYTLLGASTLMLHLWMARFTRYNFFLGQTPFYTVYIAIKRFKELKYLSIPYLASWIIILVLVVLFVPIK